MFIKKIGIIIIMFLLIQSTLMADINNDIVLKTGEIIPEVICIDDPGQSYALYLPKSYSADKKWPVLYLFEPGARAMIPVKLFKEAAEKYKYILICSYNSKNGPGEPVTRAMRALWKDSKKRLSINSKRIYAGGFSGGARVSSQFTHVVKNFSAGVIAFGAGLSQMIKPKHILPSDYFGAVGMADFNFREMFKLDIALEKAKVFHRILYFEGVHRWPSKYICTKAIEWMEIRAMKRGLINRDKELIEVLYRKYLKDAGDFKTKDRFYRAFNEYKACEKLFDGLIDISLAREGKDLLKGKYDKFIKREKKRMFTELSILKNFYKVIYLLGNKDNTNVHIGKYLNKLPFKKLSKMAKSEKNVYEMSMAKRLLASIKDTSIRKGYRYLQGKKYEKSKILLEIATKSGDTNPNLFYNLACSFAQCGNKGKALNALKQAINNGFKNISLLKKDKDLEPVRETKKFNKLIENLNKIIIVNKEK